jgi:outer membrane receptor protein involved in Fe transport
MTPNHFSTPSSMTLATLARIVVTAVRVSVSVVFLCVFGSGLLVPMPAGAQDAGGEDVWAGVEEMVVSGSTAGGILADVARSNSVTAFSADDLEAIGAADISDIANFTPNLEIVTAGSTTPTFFIRGIGLNDFSANAAGAVAVYTDDVPLNNPALQLGALFDIENAAVLRGPQGTGPFRNASAGAIKVYSRKPTGDFGATIKAEFGNYESRDLEGSIQFPITDDTLWARVAFRSVDREGTYKNRCYVAPARSERAAFETFCGEKPVTTGSQKSRVDPNGPKWLNSRSNWALRGVFLFQPEVSADVDMDWLFSVRGSRRDEPSFVGQSIGTGGTNREIDPTITDPQEVIKVTNDLRPPIFGLFGGPDQGSYQSPEVVKSQENSEAAIIARCAPNCTIGESFGARFEARRRVSHDLARDLDSSPHVGAISHPGGTTNDTFGTSLKGTIEFGDTMELISISGYDEWQRVVDIDLDFTPNTRFENSTEDEGYQWYQELRLTGQSFDGLDEVFGGPLDWEMGAFILTENLDVDTRNNFGGLGPGVPRRRKYTQDIRSIAGYVSASWDFWDAFTLDGGFRYNWEKRQIDYILFTSTPSKVKDDLTGSEPTGTMRLTWRPNEESSLYMKYTHGWKSGTFNASGSVKRNVLPAGPEKIDAFEIGLRGSYFEDRLNLTLSLFHYDYKEYQLFTSIDEVNQPVQFVILNASDVELFGSEVEATILPWEGGLLDIKFAWLEGEFLDFVQTQLRDRQIGFSIQQIQTEVDNSGNRLLNAPRYSVTLTLQQAFPLGRFGSMVARWDGTWKEVTYFDASEGRGGPNKDGIFILPKDTIAQEAFWIHNLRLAYHTPDESIEVALWMRNVENRTYKSFAADVTAFQKTTLYFVGDPRTYGVTTSIRF